MANYKMFIKTEISICDTEMIVNYHNQGWEFYENDNYYSGMVVIGKTLELEIDPDNIPAYAAAFGHMTGYELCYIYSDNEEWNWNDGEFVKVK